MKWYVKTPGSSEPSPEFSSYREARADARADCQTDASPRRIAPGFYELIGAHGGNGRYIRLIGTANGFVHEGYPNPEKDDRQ